MSMKLKPTTRAQTRATADLTRAPGEVSVVLPRANDQKFLLGLDPMTKDERPEKKRRLEENFESRGGEEMDEGETLRPGEMSDDGSLPGAFAMLAQGRNPTEKQHMTGACAQPSGPLPDNPAPPPDPGPHVGPGELAQPETTDSGHPIAPDPELDNAVGQVREVEQPSTRDLAVQEKKIRKNVLTTAVRDTLYTLCGWETSADVMPMQRGEDSQPSFWTTDPQGKKRLAPAWNLGFDANWDEWGPDYLEMFRQKEKERACASYLASLEDGEIQHRLRIGTWATCNSVRNRKSKGTYEQGQTRRTVIALNTKQRKNLLKARMAARTGTCLESEEFDFLFVPCAQSPEVSDAEDNTRVIRREPKWFSAEIAEIKSALDRKSGLEPRKLTVVYVKYDVPMREPGNGKRYPYWAIDKQWEKDHPDEFAKAKFLINMNATVKPDTRSLTGNHGKFMRKYIENTSAPATSNNRHAPSTSSSVQTSGRSTLATLTSTSDENPSLTPVQTFLLIPTQTPAYPGTPDPQATPIDPRPLVHPQLAQAARVAYASYSATSAQPAVQLPIQPAAQPLVESTQPVRRLKSPVAPLVFPDSRFAEAFVPPTLFPHIAISSQRQPLAEE